MNELLQRHCKGRSARPVREERYGNQPMRVRCTKPTRLFSSFGATCCGDKATKPTSDLQGHSESRRVRPTFLPATQAAATLSPRSTRASARQS
jgi:hypothetical protein